MSIRSLSDLNAAFVEGRWHLQRFYKAAGTAHGLQWADPSFAAGQPAYDAHVGTSLEFTPCVAARNDAIWFPGIGADQHRHLVSASFRSAQTTFNGPGSVIIYDLLGYYPLIDGDSTDTQTMDNAATLPRYTDGAGVFPVMVNHVAPATQNGVAVIEYTSSDGASRSVTRNVAFNGQNLVCSGSRTTALTEVGPLAISLDGNDAGVRSIDSVTYTTPPSGLHVIYLVRPLATLVTGDNGLVTEKNFATMAAWGMPRIYDGAWLGWVDRIGSGTSRTVTWFGHFTFAWG